MMHWLTLGLAIVLDFSRDQLRHLVGPLSGHAVRTRLAEVVSEQPRGTDRVGAADDARISPPRSE
ncbi:MAG: hypothetical protein IID42_10445 [Planctomycetes bacterium]|nr:hypothetical protein [Planctomycetota bacterium]